MYYPYYWLDYRQSETMQLSASIQNYSEFLRKLQGAINDQASAVRFYQQLVDAAPTQTQKDSIAHARDDEVKHLRMFTDLYRRLTGREPLVRPEETKFESFKEGLETAFYNELEAAELYREMYLASSNLEIRDIFFEAMTDEMEHAARFSFIYHQQ